MTERRYTEDEVAAIFERAAEAQHTGRRQLPPAEGMTLAELQEIGREVGFAPELVAEAARSLGHARQPTSRRLLGLPIGVGRTVELGRKLTNAEWERLVVDLRETFDARGSVRHDGPFRQWTNGNLQALLEPTPTGQRLRLQTVNGSARSLMGGGLALVGIAAAVVMTSVVTGTVAESARALTMLSALGVGMFGIGALRLPAWARQRRQQMEAVAERLALTARTEPEESND